VHFRKFAGFERGKINELASKMAKKVGLYYI